jgi:hypothetical protein
VPRSRPRDERHGSCDFIALLWDRQLHCGAAMLRYWYFGEVTKMKADVGVSEVEKQAARAKEHA